MRSQAGIVSLMLVLLASFRCSRAFTETLRVAHAMTTNRDLLKKAEIVYLFGNH